MISLKEFRLPGTKVAVEPIRYTDDTAGVRLSLFDAWEVLDERQVHALIARLEMALRGTYPVAITVRRAAEKDMPKVEV